MAPPNTAPSGTARSDEAITPPKKPSVARADPTASNSIQCDHPTGLVPTAQAPAAPIDAVAVTTAMRLVSDASSRVAQIAVRGTGRSSRKLSVPTLRSPANACAASMSAMSGQRTNPRANGRTSNIKSLIE
jgi:hypothetical protein